MVGGCTYIHMYIHTVCRRKKKATMAQNKYMYMYDVES